MHEIVIIQRMVKFARAKEHCGKKQRKAAIKSKKSLQKSFLRAKIQKRDLEEINTETCLKKINQNFEKARKIIMQEK